MNRVESLLGTPSHRILSEQDASQVHQVSEQVVVFSTFTDQIASASVAVGGSRSRRQHFVPAGSAPAHRRGRRNYAVEGTRHRIDDVRRGRAARLVLAGVVVVVF